MDDCHLACITKLGEKKKALTHMLYIYKYMTFVFTQGLGNYFESCKGGYKKSNK
jgi:hypothetical protein